MELTVSLRWKVELVHYSPCFCGHIHRFPEDENKETAGGFAATCILRPFPCVCYYDNLTITAWRWLFYSCGTWYQGGESLPSFSALLPIPSPAFSVPLMSTLDKQGDPYALEWMYADQTSVPERQISLWKSILTSLYSPLLMSEWLFLGNKTLKLNLKGNYRTINYPQTGWCQV